MGNADFSFPLPSARLGIAEVNDKHAAIIVSACRSSMHHVKTGDVCSLAGVMGR